MYRTPFSDFWWLASPSDGSSSGVYNDGAHCVNDNSAYIDGNHVNRSYSARPVVCIQKSSGFTYTLAPES